MNDFQNTKQWKEGEAVVQFLDSYFRFDGWHVSQTTQAQERQQYLGDRVFSRGGKFYFIEYKSGLQTFVTGNVFLETVSVDKDNKPGWVYTCRAHYILYATLLNHSILVFEPETLRANIEGLKALFRTAASRAELNKGYRSHGVLVPLKYAEQHLSLKVIRL